MKENAKNLVRYFLMMAMVLVMFVGVKTTALAHYETLEIDDETVTEDVERNTWSYDASTRTLTLNGFNIKTSRFGIKFRSDDTNAVFNIILKGDNVIEADNYGITIDSDTNGACSLNIRGTGKLTVSSKKINGIYCNGNINIDGCTIVSTTSTSYGYAAIEAEKSITIKNKADVTARATNSAGSTTYGIYAMMKDYKEENYGISIIDSKVVASTATRNGAIQSDQGDIEIGRNADVTAEGGKAGFYIFNYKKTITIAADVKSLVAIGGENAIYANRVINALDGTGWEIEDDEVMSVDLIYDGSEAKSMFNYQKLVFPKAIPSLDVVPMAKDLTYTGELQELVTAGKSVEGRVEYALGASDKAVPRSDSFDYDIPRKINVGTYYVWYRTVGSPAYDVSEAKCITVKIKSADDDTGKKENEVKPNKPATEVRTTQVSESVQAPADTENIDNTQKNTTLSKPKADKKSITLTWKKVTAKGIKGYEIQYSTDKAFSKDKTKKVTIKNVKTTKTKIKKLKSKTKYYIRIRTFSNKNGEKVYSNWSKAKNVKVK
ncbi:fibronectin type III domain-containing protein [Butyrivibrio sp. WCD3002]|uniref:fibronectin type III domain-containing protein n=1 Tax=Butyrivibrio sp. WCD3002 TaxID=1280676 RepID=UPI0004117366|nr:fibronectin type III domain-containing protein [Butyrivibrio sp. WCD3002]